MAHPPTRVLTHLALLGCFVLTLVLAVLSLQPRPNPRFTAFDPSSLGHGEKRLYSRRPVDFMSPQGLSLTAPHPLAREADELFLIGSPRRALELYEQAAADQPRDLYSSFVAACLCAEMGQVERGLEHAENLLRFGDSLRSAHLLREYLIECSVPGRRPEVAYLRALARLARNPLFVVFPNIDPLHDLVEERLLTAPSPRPLRELGDPDLQAVLDLSGPAPSLGRARAVLDRDGTLPQYLLAMTMLYPRAPAHDLPLLEDVLLLLSSQEPTNSYYDYMLAALRSPELLHPVHQFEGDLGRWLSEGSLEALRRAFEKPDFDPHVREIDQVCVEARRRAGQQFAELHVPPVRRLMFLGDEFYARRLANTALTEGFQVESPESWALVYGALALLSHWPATCPDPFAGEPVTEYYGPMFLEHPVALGLERSEVTALVRKLPASPVTPAPVRLLQRYTRGPLPIPTLIREFHAHYACDPARLVRELTLALEQI